MQSVVAGVVVGRAQVARSIQLPFADAREGVGLDPLAVAGREVVHEQELVRALHTVNGKGDGRTWPIHGDPGGSQLSACDPGQAGAGPHPEDGAHREVRVDDGGAVQRVEGHRVPLAAHRVLSRGLLGGGRGDHAGVLQVLEQNVVGQDVDGELLVPKLVEAGHFVTRGGADFVCDLLASAEEGQDSLGC